MPMPREGKPPGVLAGRDARGGVALEGRDRERPLPDEGRHAARHRRLLERLQRLSRAAQRLRGDPEPRPPVPPSDGRGVAIRVPGGELRGLLPARKRANHRAAHPRGGRLVQAELHGNVWEWTSTPVGGSRTLVGGSALEAAAECSASARSRRWAAPEQSFNDAGMRLLADCAGEKPSARRRRKSVGGKYSPSAASEAEEREPVADPVGAQGSFLEIAPESGMAPIKPITIKPVSCPPPAESRRPGLFDRLRNLFGRS